MTEKENNAYVERRPNPRILIPLQPQVLPHPIQRPRRRRNLVHGRQRDIKPQKRNEPKVKLPAKLDLFLAIIVRLVGELICQMGGNVPAPAVVGAVPDRLGVSLGDVRRVLSRVFLDHLAVCWWHLASRVCRGVDLKGDPDVPHDIDDGLIQPPRSRFPANWLPDTLSRRLMELIFRGRGWYQEEHPIGSFCPRWSSVRQRGGLRSGQQQLINPFTPDLLECVGDGRVDTHAGDYVTV